jgi:uncharacterized protein (TIGR02145 family)
MKTISHNKQTLLSVFIPILLFINTVTLLRSQFQPGLKADEIFTAACEVPVFNPVNLQFKQGETIHATWTADTTENDTIHWTFHLDSSDRISDTIFSVSTSVCFNRKLDAELRISNNENNRFYFLSGYIDLVPGNWKFHIDSVYTNEVLPSNFFEWVPMYDDEIPSWKILIKNTLELSRTGYTIDLVPDESFCGSISLLFTGRGRCTNDDRTNLFIEFIPELHPPVISEDYIEIFEGQELPDIFAEGENIKWYSDSSNTLYDFRDNQMYDVVTIGQDTWMNENLNFFTNSGSFYTNHDSLNYHLYGRRYAWDLAENVCPQGWKITDRHAWWRLLDIIDTNPRSVGFQLTPPWQDLILHGLQFWAPCYGFGTDPAGYVILELNGNDTIQQLYLNKPGAVDVSTIPGFHVRCRKDIYQSVIEGKMLPLEMLEEGNYKFYATQTICKYESEPDTLTIHVKPRPDIPKPDVTFNQVEICEGEVLPVIAATGDKIRWYCDSVSLSTELGVGEWADTLNIIMSDHDLSEGLHHYVVTQSMNGWEGPADTVSITVHPTPDVDLGKDTVISLGQTTIIGCNRDYAHHLWNTGATDAHIELNADSIGPGEHMFWMTAYNYAGCSSTDTVIVQVSEPTNQTFPGNNHIKIYPNPAYDNINVHMITGYKGLVTCKLINCTGTILLKNQWYHTGESHQTIEVAFLSKGYYVLVFKWNGHTKVRSLMLY